jgi:hypothetical protein
LRFVARFAVGEDPGRLIFKTQGVGSQACHAVMLWWLATEVSIPAGANAGN